MRYRAQGAGKGAAFGKEVTELDSLREIGRASSRVFGEITDDEIKEQVQNIMLKKDKILASISDPKLRRTMEQRINSLSPLTKAKYLKRWRGKNGNWEYLYPQDKKGRTKKQEEEKKPRNTRVEMTPMERAKILKQFRRRAPGEGKEKTIQKKADLEVLLKESTFCMMSAGRNPEDPEDMKLSDKEIKQRYNNLLSDLAAKGYIYTRCKGKYVNPEESVMVMAHDADRNEMMEIGEKYKQDSVVFSDKGKGELIYTTGKKKGKAEMAGKGFEFVPDATDFYTKMPLADGSYFKFTINLEDVMKALGLNWLPEDTLLKHMDGTWHLYRDEKLTRFYWFHGLEEVVKAKTYYSADEIKAKGMRWVTIRGARVLVQGLEGGGFAVVGGAGGKLNHLKIDKIMDKKEYSERRKKVEKKRKEDLRELSKEEIHEQAIQRKAEIVAKKTA